uniref:Variant surface glycoprotein 1125.106 n=1 Tax=Trypanosoma brucei TaxID=5691 RepID=M4SWT1_9TRYP|nr:variant surface glycoprotein 308 [Trypanosoma brucei]APD72969.1 variant surface glycoprotein 1125.106 [Trypanosoma brucei]
MAFSSINKIAQAMFLLSLATLEAFAAQDNATKYRDMCAILKMLTQRIPATQSKDSSDKAVASVTAASKMAAIYGNIVRLNLTVAPDEILAVLSDQAKYKDGKTVKANAEVKDVFTGVDEGTIDVMFSQAPKLRGSGADKEFTQKYGVPIDLATRERLRLTAAALANKATALRNRLITVGHQADALRTQTRKLMLKALYGEAYLTKNDAAITAEGEAPALTENEFFWTSSDTRDNNSKTATGEAGKAGHCLAQDMVCLCVSGHNSRNQYCTNQQNGNDNYSGSTATKTTALCTYNKVATACQTGNNGHTNLQVSSAALTTATTALTANFGTNWVNQAGLGDANGNGGEKSGILGVYNVAGATGVACSAMGASPLSTSGGKGVCINYGNLLKTATGIPWINTVLEAAENLKKIYEDSVDLIGIVKSAEAVESQIENLLLIRNLLTQAGTKDGQQKVATPTQEEQIKCKNPPNKTAEGFANVGCDFDSDKNKCKPKPGAANTAAGAGDGNAGEQKKEEKCTRKLEDACKKESNCKWENNACKDSSILVNKQFALSVVSASFVALLF